MEHRKLIVKRSAGEFVSGPFFVARRLQIGVKNHKSKTVRPNHD
jgi:hypothetical protein